MLAPQYWAGLVTMGNTTPILLKQKTSGWIFLILGFMFLFVVGYFVYRRKKGKEK
jgi:LPXTG-motif cell wall-anchored protein